MKKTLIKDVLRQIKATKNRFISILIIVALGTGFYAGLKAVCPDMIEMAQEYYTDTNLMDIEIVSTMGFDEDDILYIRENLSDIKALKGGYTADMFASRIGSDRDYVIKVYSIDPHALKTDANYISVPYVTEGRMIEAADECVVDIGFSGVSDFQVGDKIVLYGEDGIKEEDDSEDALKINEFTVVGKVSTPVYISHERGQSTVGSGSVSSYIYIDEEAFDYDVYTNLYMNFTASSNMYFDDPVYEQYIDAKTDELERIASERNPMRLKAILDEAYEEINDAQIKIDDGYSEYYSGKSTFEREIRSAQREIDRGWDQIEEFEDSLPELQKQYDDGIAEYEKGLKEYEDGLNTLKENEEMISMLRTVREHFPQIRDAADELTKIIDEYIEENGPVVTDEPTKELIRRIVGEINSVKEKYAGELEELGITLPDISADEIINDLTIVSGITENLDEYINEAQRLIDETIKQYEDGLVALEEGKKQLDDGKKQLDELKSVLDNADETISDTKAQLRSGQRQLDREKSSYSKELSDGKKELDDAQAELNDAKAELEDLEEPEWYIYDRNNNPGYAGYVENTQRVDRVAVVFPVFFVAVAMLVSLTTMSRMVEEQRTQIGTLKALGYSNMSIMAKYIVYAVSASVIGSIVGMGLGFYILPLVIYNAYRTMYSMPDLTPVIYWDTAALCMIVAVACTALSAVYSCNKELKEKPASLMRARAPKIGKRVFLERIPFVWNRLNFMQKVSVRNMLRYKKRIAMTVIGIAGCTALLVAAFGLQNSISAIADLQYGEIFKYNISSVLADDFGNDDIDGLYAYADSIENISDSMLVYQSTLNASREGYSDKEVYLFIPQYPERIEPFISLRERKSREGIVIEEGSAVINEKLSKLFDLDVGDEISVRLSSGKQISVAVSAITENYALNYVYMSPKTYKSLTGEDISYNMLLGNLADTEMVSDTSRSLMENEHILTVVNMATSAQGTFDGVAEKLSLIIVVLIVCSGLLEIVVLYNLASINIAERVREIATIKVLGFYENEVSDYISRENVISTAIGIICGLLIGIPFEKFIVSAAEVDAVMFAPNINFMSFVAATMLSIVFAWAVNIIMYFQLKKIPMAESLKSVE
ncbi:MAG: FtsX-like permease family protein [Anaerofustis stercorihominis]|nr:FtsX-like permease family protein [Anaerofustis stercorihominis]